MSVFRSRIDVRSETFARNREEMLLFYETLTRATRRLYLSYPAMDESAQPLLPSPYLGEVEQACGPGSIRRTELSDLRPIPTDGDPLGISSTPS